MNPTIAIVGMACRYPDANSPQQLWENALAQRRAFRQIPPERLSLDDYFSGDRSSPDCTYAREAALIEGYEFDRVGFRVVGSTYRSADLAHWLALDIASQALADAGFEGGKDLPRQETGVFLGNTLTGEFSRANTLRLRWPYVRRVVEAKLIEEEMPLEDRLRFLQELETKFKEPFPPMGEESLAGNLSNTIAGRICNHFDLKGGGYVVDGACSSSLLAAANACSALVAGDLDVALAGGVDISIDPFELIGFARVGALTSGEMWVYDRRSSGFIPGEGCGLVVLMRYEDAIAQRKRIYGFIRGWGISSDGHGGITRPEVGGQLLAVRRAYRRAGFGIDTVPYFEGHGTGTAVGDATELQVLNNARWEEKREKEGESQIKAVIGSIKANIGHTKAAAGIAGLIKATMAVYSQVLPPTTGCEQPHPQLTEENAALQVLKTGQLWSESAPLRAAVSSMGFGGINAHLVLEGNATVRRQTLTPREKELIASPQDAELIFLSAQNSEELSQKVERLLTIAPRLSRAEVADLAAELARNLDPSLPLRAAIVTSDPQELSNNLQTLLSTIQNPKSKIQNQSGIYLGTGEKSPKIGFLFPGQASPVYLDGGAWQRRFPFLQDLYARADLPQGDDVTSTATAQPAIATASRAGLEVLKYLGVEADVAVGHSLGELCALHWAGAFDGGTLVSLAKFRGQIMAEFGNPAGAMASIGAGEEEVRGLLNCRVVAIAGLNSPSQTVISGEQRGIEEMVERAQARGLKAIQLPVSHAFHSPSMAAAVNPLAEYLAQQTFSPLQKSVASTVTGSILEEGEDLRSLLVRQMTAPVRFLEAASLAAQDLDLFIEVGPGQILSRLVAEFTGVPVVALDASGPSLKGLLQALGAAFALGVQVNHQALFAGRFTRPFNLDWQPRFFANPCELAPVSQGAVVGAQGLRSEQGEKDSVGKDPDSLAKVPESQPQIANPASKIHCVRQLVAQKTELPLEAIEDGHRLLGDLHLNSIAVAQLVVEAARSLGLSPPVAPTDYANATVAEIAEALESLSEASDATEVETIPAGIDSWIGAFTVELVENPLSSNSVRQPHLNGRRAGEVKSQESAWEIIAPGNYPLAEALEGAFKQVEGKGVVVCLPPNPDESHLELLLTGAKTATAQNNQPANQNHFVLVQHGGGGASFARTFHLENLQVTTSVVDVPLDSPQAVEWTVAEVLAARGYTEAYYDLSGKRRSPVLRLLPMLEGQAQSISPLTAKDVLCITGGGKGIAAECALSIARETGVRLALLGRSIPENDAELARNLERMHSAGIEVEYLACDVADAGAIRGAIAEIEGKLGTVTAIIHGAGINKPKLIQNLAREDFLHTLAPKVKGLENLLAAIQPQSLKLLITFGSIIARTGLPGEADYGLANEWLGRRVAEFKEKHPHCHCLNLEWSVWSGVGMGQRLGRIDTLMQQGITPIPPDTGIDFLRRLMDRPLRDTSVVISGRFGEPPTLKVEQPELPFLRFLERPRVYYPGVELVVDVELSPEHDPYLEDHVYQGERIFPGVMGLEAMAQVAQSLVPLGREPILLQSVRFNRPIVVAQDSPLKIRIAALVRDSAKVEVAIRSQQTGFSADHFQATFGKAGDSTQAAGGTILNPQFQLLNRIDPERDLYGDLLFHRGRFQRIRGYRHLKATECIAEIRTDVATPWFSRYLPQDLILGDPGARDAAIHALQACVPHATILPVAVETIAIHSLDSSGNRSVWGKERERIGDRFIYDLTVVDGGGTVLEIWQGLELQAIQHRDPREPWNPNLLAPYLERSLKEFIPDAALTIVVDRDATVARRVRSDRGIFSIHHSPFTIQNLFRRPDGKPELSNGKAVSASHAGDLTLVVGGSPGCDLEPVVSREEQVWQDLLGVGRFDLARLVAQEAGESLDLSATRIWCARECLQKAGVGADAPLLLMQAKIEGVWLKSGENAIATFVVPVGGVDSPLVFALLVNGGEVQEGKS